MTETLTQPAPAEKKVLPLETVAALETAMSFIRREFRSNPSFPEIAERAFLSAFHFHRLFTKHFGVTPKSAVDELRIIEAKRLLLADVPAAEIATKLGWSHQSHFTYVFATKVGLPPVRWLRRQRLADGAEQQTPASAGQ